MLEFRKSFKTRRSDLLTCVDLVLLVSSLVVLPVLPASSAPEENVYIFYSKAPHGPKVQNYPTFYRTWKKRLTDRGLNVTGGTTFPDKKALKQTNLLLIYRKGFDDVSGTDRNRFEQFVKQGGGVVVLHNGVRSKKHPDWYRSVIGGAFVPSKSKTSVNELQGYYFNNDYRTSTLHPIIQGVSNMDLPKEEVFWKMRMADDAHVLAKSYHKLGVIAPQSWTTTHGDGRVFVWLTGHRQTTFNRPHVRGVLLRGLTWAANREPVDQLLTEKEKSRLKYHEGGPVAPEKAA